MAVYESVVDTVGKTPLVALRRFGSGLEVRILAKLELRNPCGSIKDRIGLAMIREAEATGQLRPDSIIVEASSGNTGIALASAAAALGYRCVIVMPESMSRERVAMLKMFGARVVLTRGGLMGEAVARARELVNDDPRAVSLEQFENEANPAVHQRTTGPELWADSGGDVDVFVAGVGTGGTITGVGRFLKEQNPAIRVVAVEPVGSAVLSGEAPGPHYIQGIGAGFVPEVLDRSIIDEVATVSEDDAMACALELARREGILAGISSGANLAVVRRLAAREELSGKTIATVLCDTGERYLSTPLADLARGR